MGQQAAGKINKGRECLAGSGKLTLTVELRIAINHGSVEKVKIHKSFAFLDHPVKLLEGRQRLKE